MKELLQNITKLENYRLYVMHGVILLLFFILVLKLFSLQIAKGEYFSQEVNGTALREVEVEAARGTIYDRYGRPLAINNTAYAVSLDPSVGVDNLNKVLSDLIDVLEKNDEKIVETLPITSSLPHEFLFDGSESQEKRWKEDMNLDQSYTAEQCFNELEKRFELSDDIDNEKAGKILALRCALYKRRYSKYIPVTVAYNVSEKTLTTLREQGSSFPCAFIDTQSNREYPYGKYFSHILGYIGNITDEELKEKSKDGYSINDNIGKDGIEKAYEDDLRGTDGSQYIEVDSSGRRISTIENEGVSPSPGNNVYLTIDAELQKKAYDALEDALTEVQLDRLTGGADYGYSVSDVFESMIESNNIRIKNILNSADDTTQGKIKSYILSQDENAASDVEKAREILLTGYKQNAISGSQLLIAMYEQGLITDDDEIITKLKSGAISSSTALISKMRSQEITPQMTAMDPCTGSVVVNDVNSGDVLAAVTYPSYDNNELVNSFNNEYYINLQNDPTTPMVNRPYQEPRAPGSTFKMITAAAALEEGIIGPNTTIYDEGTFTEAGKPYARCWIGSGSGSHGYVNVSEALEVSCNYFFYTVAYNMGSDAITKLNNYMRAFGLDNPTGVEIYELYDSMTDYPSRISSPEYKEYVAKQRYENPTASDLRWTAGDTIRTAIGQSSNNYTAATLAKYIATLANGGTRYKNHFMSKITDSNGNLLSEYEDVIEEQLSLKESTLDAIFEGMNLVTNGEKGTLRNSFKDYPVNVAAKSGTAQESQKRSEHTIFVAFAPYESPEISISVLIPYGNNASTAPAPTVAKEVISKYMQLDTTVENRSYDALVR
ncbi:MAG: penicillin-binding transpeptidase domain-containing protein [Clostridia bacterium]|nr:penicillin-binding transpeptidase domain-containing protein [Clostridia bacterium]